MRKVNYILTLLLLAIGATWAKADDQTLALGNYDEVVTGDWNEDQTYQGSWWMISPTQFNVKHTGSQIIYTKEQLADMAGKEIKGISFAYYNQGAFNAFARTVNVWIKEIDDSEFAYDASKKAYKYFEYSDATKAIAEYSADCDFSEYYCLNGELVFSLDKPFAYSGNKNLLVTITFDGDDTADSPTDIEFYYNTSADKMAMTTSSDKSSFADFNESEDWPYATGGGSSISHANQLAQPLTKFTYQESTKPVVKDATLSGVVKCGETPVEDATVRLSADGKSYDSFTDAEGKYTTTIPAENIDKNYTLTVTADGYEDYTAEGTVTFASGEAKTLDISLTKKVLPANLSGVVKCGETPVENATVRLSADGMSYDNFTDAEGKYTVTIPAENISKEYTLTVTADGYDDYKYAQTLTFTSGEEKTQDINLTKKDNPSTMTGKVTANGEPVVGAKLKLAAKDNKYITYSATTSEDGSYLVRVVKSDKTYTLTVTDGECEDYSEDNVTFTPGETTIKDIKMTKAQEPENSVTLGRYDKLLKDGTQDDVYDGHGYSWAAAPTNFSHKYTGSEIVYTKEQLQKMAGKAITKMNFVFHNEGAYDSYPRTVKVWVKEIDEDAFVYDTKAGAYKFFEYENATPAIAGYEYEGELYNYAGGNGELELEFDRPLNYSGEKNLLVALTFEGDNTCNVLDFNFFYNPDATKKAMSYFSDRYTFGDYAETEDWPYVNDDCVSGLEQPVTRFFYTEATGIHCITSATADSMMKNGKTYNLAGQRVGKDYKGIVICNGKKFKK